MGADGFPRCESKRCPSKGKAVPKVAVDHIDPVGEVAGPHYFKRLFVPSNQLQNLCKACHRLKTNAERAEARAKTKPKGKAVRPVKPGVKKSFCDEF